VNNNSNTTKPKLVNNQAIYSIILGIIGVAVPCIAATLYGGHAGWVYRGYPGCIIVTGICVTLGLFFGIRGLKSTKKLAIIGIIVCSISLVFWMYFSLNWLYFILF
jgi:uncharacterized membrane protein YbaN (DUF454 family)